VRLEQRRFACAVGCVKVIVGVEAWALGNVLGITVGVFI